MKKINFLFLSVFIIILIYIFFKSEIIFQGNNREYYKIYYVIFLLLIFCLIITFYLMKRINLIILIFITSSFFSFYLFETYLTFVKLKNWDPHLIQRINYYKETGKKYDLRSKYRFYSDLKINNEDVVLWVPPIQFEYNNKIYTSSSGISNKLTILDNENGYYATYLSDRYGFNNPDTEWNKKNVDYLLIGDSFLQGFSVNGEDNIASNIRKISNKTVLNLGYGGNGPYESLVALKEYYVPNTKNILFFFYEGNDLFDLKISKFKKLRDYFKNLNFNNQLKKKQKIIDKKQASYLKQFLEKGDSFDKDHNDMINLQFKKNFLSYKILKFVKLYNLRLTLFHKNHTAKIEKIDINNKIKELENIILEMNNFAQKNNSNFYFVYLPEYQRYNKKFKFSLNDKLSKIQILLKSHNINFINIHEEVFLKQKNPLDLFPYKAEFIPNSHYNETGYKKIGDLVYKYLNR